MLFYFIPFLIAVVATVGTVTLLSTSPFFTRFFSSSVGRRHRGGKGLLRIGGLGIASVFVSVLIIHPSFVIDDKTFILLFLALSMGIVGMIDDLRRLSWYVQLGAQVVIAFLLSFFGMGIMHITAPLGGVVSFEQGAGVFIGALITIVWCIIIINALNWSDGMHGIFGGIGVIATVTIAILALRPDVYQPPVALMSWILAGSMSGFLISNLFGKRVIAGTAGTFFFGFMVAALAIFAGAKIGTALLVLIVPLVDALYVLQQRLYRGKKVVAADTTHLHHRLADRGFSHRKILLIYYSLTLLGAVAALMTQSLNKVIVFTLYGAVLFGAFFFFTTTTQSNA